MKIMIQSLFIWSSVLVAGGIPPEQLTTHVEVGVAASRDAHALSSLLGPALLKKAQDQALLLARNKDGMFEPEVVGCCCNQVVQGFAGGSQQRGEAHCLQSKFVAFVQPSPATLSVTLAATILDKKLDKKDGETLSSCVTVLRTDKGSGDDSASSVVAVAKKSADVLPESSGVLLVKNKIEDTDAPTKLCKRLSMKGAFQPYCVYRFGTTMVKRPITPVTSGSYVLYSALSVKDLWQKYWSCQPSSGEQDLSEFVKEKTAIMQRRVKDMVEKYGEQVGPQVYLTDKDLLEKLSKKTFEKIDPFKNVFTFSQERKMMVVKTSSLGDVWKTCEEVAGQKDELSSFLVRCTKPKEEACACVIGTFVEPFATYDHVATVVCKKVGEIGPTFIYIDPLNRGMKKNPRAYLFVSFLLKQAINCRLADKDNSQEDFLARVQKIFQA